MATELLAPLDGRVEKINLREGDSIGQRVSVTGQHLESWVVKLVPTRGIYKMAGTVDEVDIAKVAQDYKQKQNENKKQEAIITVDAFPGREMKGYVTFISPFSAATVGVVEFPVTIKLEPADVELFGGLTATAEIIIGEKHQNVLRIPSRAVKGSEGAYWVDVIINEKAGATEKRTVVLGLQNKNYSEVISGLTEGEKLIVGTLKATKAASVSNQ